MELPIPEKSASQSRTSKTLVTFAIAFWVLILSGVFAGLIVTVGSTNSEKKVAAGTRQNAYRELLPALELVDNINQSNREEALLEALDIIDKNVLKIDPRHPLAIQTKDEIQIELGLMKESTIGGHEKTISEQVRNLDQARKEIERLEAQVQKMDSANAGLNRDKAKLSRDIGGLQQKMKQIDSNSAKEIADKDREISDLQQQINDMEKQSAANNNNNNNQQTRETKGILTRRRS